MTGLGDDQRGDGSRAAIAGHRLSRWPTMQSGAAEETAAPEPSSHGVVVDNVKVSVLLSRPVRSA